MFFGPVKTESGKVYRFVVGKEQEDIPWEEYKKDSALRKEIDVYERKVRCEGVEHFNPSGPGGLAFLNDTTSDVKLVIAPNGSGKSVHAVIDVILSSIPCKPDWDIFVKHGVKFREWGGKKNVIVATYQTSLHKQTLWPELQKWLPEDELLKYGKFWWNYKTKKEPSWKDNPIIKLKCGTTIAFMTYEQDQQAYESFAADIILWDEQGKEHLFDAADERVRRKDGRHVFALTPHIVEGRPDTGWGSWIHKMQTGEKRKGLDVKCYTITLDDVPEYVLTKDRKKQAYEKWITEPQKNNDPIALAEGRARYFGEWHKGSGLVLDNLQPEIHFIDPIKIDNSYTLFRAVDHGTNNPTACLWFAVNKDGFIFIYREYYQSNRTIFQNCRAIIEASGNKIAKLDNFHDDITGQDVQMYEEVFEKERFAKTVLDSRSFATKDATTGRPTGWLYKACGLFVQPASGKQTTYIIPAVKELLRVNADLKHPITGKMGSPRMLIFNTLPNFKREWMGWTWETNKSATTFNKNLKELPRDKDNHEMVCAIYGVQIPLRYLGDYDVSTKSKQPERDIDDPEPQGRKMICRRTGY
jgi:hypothetical protein